VRCVKCRSGVSRSRPVRLSCHTTNQTQTEWNDSPASRIGRAGALKGEQSNIVFKVSDYREHAGECRRLARESVLPHIREELLKMAATWDDLADQREREIRTRAPGLKTPSNAGGQNRHRE
jgi:hypothetical protein